MGMGNWIRYTEKGKDIIANVCAIETFQWNAASKTLTLAFKNGNHVEVAGPQGEKAWCDIVKMTGGKAPAAPKSKKTTKKTKK